MGITPTDLAKIEQHTSNIYEAVIVSSKRARQINNETRLEFNTLINSLVSEADEDFEERENPDQLRISLEFEKREKPQLQALQEVIDGNVEFRYKETEENEQ